VVVEVRGGKLCGNTLHVKGSGGGGWQAVAIYWEVRGSVYKIKVPARFRSIFELLTRQPHGLAMHTINIATVLTGMCRLH
jgi:hypothetical protein